MIELKGKVIVDLILSIMSDRWKQDLDSSI